MSLRFRLILSFTAIILLCLGIVSVILSIILQDYRDRYVTSRLDDMTIPIYNQLRSMVTGEAVLDDLWRKLAEQAEGWEDINPDSETTEIYIFLLNRQGNVIRFAPSSTAVSDHQFDVPSNIITERQAITYHSTYESPDGQVYSFAAYPLVRLVTADTTSAVSVRQLGALVISVPRETLLSLWSELSDPFLWAGGTSLVISVIVALLLARSVYKPVSRLSEASQEIARGNYDFEIIPGGPKEIKNLSQNFTKMADEVKVSQQRFRDLVADVSHQLRTPLTSIRGFSRAIIDGTSQGKDERLKAAGIIEEESKKMMRQVDGLLDLSRMQLGQAKLEKNPVKIEEILDYCLETFSARAKEKDISLNKRVRPLPSVIGDADRLEQVFNNLLENAIKNTPVGGKIDVEATQSNAAIEVSVSDSGRGIAADKLSHVFERFYRASDSTPGSGLGLAIAFEIVRAHGGEIKAFSVVGSGSKFIVYLPTSESNTSSA